MKKKIIAILACGTLVFSLAACGSSETEDQVEAIDETVAEPLVEEKDDTETVADLGADEQGRVYINEFNPETNQHIVLDEIEFEVPDTWTQNDVSSGVGFTSDEAVLTVDCVDDIYDISKESNQDAFIDLYASTDESFTETGRELITILNDTPAFYFTSTRNVSGYDMECHELVFSTDDLFYMFIYGVRQDAEYNHSQEFDEIIDSITWAPEDAETEEETEEQVEEEATSVPEDDFFGDEERQEKYDELYTSYQISALYDYVNEYISETGDDISPDDSAYKILDLIEPLMDYEDTWVVTKDEFDSSYIVTFPGADEISGSESLKVTVSGSGLTQTVGFMKDDWLFFDKIALSVDGEQVMSKIGIESYNKSQDVISGGTIEESYSASNLFKDEVCEQVKDADTVMIRFENTSEDKTYDHTFTDAEKDALYVSNLLRDNWTELSNLIFRYRNNIVINEE